MNLVVCCDHAASPNTTIQHYLAVGHQVTEIVYVPGGKPYVVEQRQQWKRIHFSLALDLPGSGHLSGASRLGYVISELVAAEIRHGNVPDIIEVGGDPAWAYHLLQRKYCLDPRFQRIPIVVRNSQYQNSSYAVDRFWEDYLRHYSLRAANLVVDAQDGAGVDGFADYVLQQFRLLKNEIPVLPRCFPFVTPGAFSFESLVEPRTLSIAIPFYNMGRFLEQTVNSILASTVVPDEILIINDGSTDPQSLAVLDSIGSLSPRIRVIHQENEGIVMVRNRAAMEAEGKYLAFLDADDLVESTYLERCIAIMEHYSNVHFVGAWTRFFGEADHWWAGWNPEPPYILYHNTINSSGVVSRTWVYRLYGLNHPAMQRGMEDYESVINLIEHGVRGVVIPQPLFYYRVRQRSRSQSNRSPIRQEELYSQVVALHSTFYARYHAILSELQQVNGPGYTINSPLSFESAADR